MNKKDLGNLTLEQITEKENTHKLSDYAKFWFANSGYYWLDKASGRNIDKLVMWLKFSKFPNILQSLTLGEYENYYRIDKPNYENGKIHRDMGLVEFKKGDILECVNNKGLAGLTLGKRYTCVNYIHCTGQVMVVTDNQIKVKFGSTNFLLIN
jgi:hypothetical protein